MTEFVFNDAASAVVTRVGRRGLPVSRIENVLRNPADVAAFGFGQTYTRDAGNFYPGMRARMPESFSFAFRAWLSRVLQREIRDDSSYFSVVTTASSELLPIQRIPHYDSTDPGLLAVVIYLCDSRFAGTSFYRHRRTGYEEITAENRRNYQLALDMDMRLHGPPPKAYANGDGVLFESIFCNELRFNSGVVYPGRMLHAANIPSTFVPPRTEQDWRLTVTSLLSVQRAS
jgi:hypothetical protein